MAHDITTEYLIIGAGIAGLSLGIGLQQRKKAFIILEKSPLPLGIGAGLGITSNAITAFKQIDMHKKVIACARPLRSLSIMDQKGQLLISGDPQRVPGYDSTNYALHRADLHRCLSDELNIESILSGRTCTGIEASGNAYKVTCSDGTTVHCRYLVGADGLHSVTRRHLFPDSRIKYAGYTCWRAVVEDDTTHLPNSVETWGDKGRFGITPLINGHLYWYACINSTKARDPYYSAFTIDDLRRNFQHYHSSIVSVLQKTGPSTLIHNDISYLKPIHRYHKGSAVLIGDAAHATTPNLGQGACMGIEDVAVLLQEIDRHTDIRDAFESYTKRRQKRCRYIVKTSTAMGQMAQLDNQILIPVRNMIVRRIPDFIQKRQMRKILDTRSLF